MTLIFSGNNFKYELEAVCKLFFPVESFSFIFLDENPDAEKPEGDYCFITRIKGVNSSMLSVFASFGGRGAIEKEKLANDVPDYERKCEFIMGRLLFKALSKLTGKYPEWGILTGVRPVKLINKLRADGYNYEMIKSYLKTEYLMTDEKIEIGYKTAMNQDAVISAMPKKSFSLYVSIPFCPTRCAYCSFVSQTASAFKKLMPEYVEKLCREIEYTSELLKDSGLTLDTVYFGGGTPTSLEAGDLDRIMKTIAANFDTTHLREYTVEAGRPDTVTKEKLDCIFKNGGDRVSVNPQTIHDSVLEAIGRKHTAEQFYESFAMAEKIGFKAINVDLIAGLPTDTYEGFMESLDKMIELDPQNITVHALSIKRASDLMRDRQETDDYAAERMIKYANSRLFESGYEPYYLYRQKNQLGNQENIGWTKPGLSGIYNINIMEEVQTIIAVGAGATTKVIDGGFERFYNPKYPLEYIKNFETVLKRKEEAARLLSKAKDE